MESDNFATGADHSGGQPPSDAIDSLPDHQMIFRPEVLDTIEKTIEAIDGELRDLSINIHDNPEIAWEERKAHDTLVSFMSSHGFTVTPHYLMETAWKAEFSRGTGGRVLGINSEMDALPGIGHACGHNLIAIAGVGMALGVRAAMEKHDIPGKIVLLGTPAEEGPGGKVKLLDKGAYKEMDLCLMCHPGPGVTKSAGLGTALARQEIIVQFFGHTAHAAASPWEGQNALDAAFVAYSSIAVLRQQIKPDHRIHGIVEGRDWATNIIPDYAKMRWVARAPTRIQLTALINRLKACFEGAAMATGCRLELVYGVSYLDLRQNPALSNEFANIIKVRYGMSATSAPGAIGGSTDFGNVTYEVPGIHPSFAIPTVEGGGNHTKLFTDAARTPEAHLATLNVTKALAHTGLRAIIDDDFFNKITATFEESKHSQ